MSETVEEAIARLTACVRKADAPGAWSGGSTDVDTEDLRTLLADRARLVGEVEEAVRLMKPFAHMVKLADFYIEDVCPPMLWPKQGTKIDPCGPQPFVVGASHFRALSTYVTNHEADDV